MFSEHDPVIIGLNRHLKTVEESDDEQAAFERWMENHSFEEMARAVHGDAWFEILEGLANEAYNGYGDRVVTMARSLARKAYEMYLESEAAGAARERLERMQEVRRW
jgi:acyl-homoserine lactone acylase PvdQ